MEIWLEMAFFFFFFLKGMSFLIGDHSLFFSPLVKDEDPGGLCIPFLPWLVYPPAAASSGRVRVRGP